MTADTGALHVLDVPVDSIIHRRNAVGRVHSVSYTAWRFYHGVPQHRRETDELQVLVIWNEAVRSTVPLAKVKAVGSEFYVVD